VAGTTRRHTVPQPQLPGLRRPHNPVVVACARARLRIRSAALARPVNPDLIWPAHLASLLMSSAARSVSMSPLRAALSAISRAASLISRLRPAHAHAVLC
jgi:hypothetical protein